MSLSLSGSAKVAGVIGSPISQSLSPLIHNRWITALGLDAVYVPFSPDPARFEDFVQAQRGSALRGLNVTLPFKERALALADRVSGSVASAGAANLLLFHADGTIEAQNHDGAGLLSAFAEQAPGWSPRQGVVAVLGAGGAARGAVSALCAAGAEVVVFNRTFDRAQALVAGIEGATARPWEALAAVLAQGSAVVNATSAGLQGAPALAVPLSSARSGTVVMDMVYKPLLTPFLRDAQALGLTTVDGLAMLIGQAAPSFEALFGQPPPMGEPVRALALEALGEG